MCHCTFPLSRSQPWEHLSLGQIRCMLACHSLLGRHRHTTCTDSRGAGSFACIPSCLILLHSLRLLWGWNADQLKDRWWKGAPEQAKNKKNSTTKEHRSRAQRCFVEKEEHHELYWNTHTFMLNADLSWSDEPEPAQIYVVPVHLLHKLTSPSSHKWHHNLNFCCAETLRKADNGFIVGHISLYSLWYNWISHSEQTTSRLSIFNVLAKVWIILGDILSGYHNEDRTRQWVAV